MEEIGLLGQSYYSEYHNGGHTIIHLSKLEGCITPRVNFSVNHGFWVIIMCNLMGEAEPMWGQSICKNSVPFIQFCCEPKIALKIKSIFYLIIFFTFFKKMQSFYYYLFYS